MAEVIDRLRKTPLHALHVALGGKMVGFAGYEMPVQYRLGVMDEHLHCRAQAGLFDVSHMGQAWLRAPKNDDDKDALELLEQLTPGGLMTLKTGAMRYTQLTNEQGGILDDLMITRFDRDAWLVVNAACKETDFAHIKAHLKTARLEIKDRALLAVQGPIAAQVLAKYLPDCTALRFMQARWMQWQHGGQSTKILLSRCGYTGEDGFEISLPSEQGAAFARLLLEDERVEMVGLGARDSLRLEAGLCLYGADIDTTISPIEANLSWSVPKRRRQQGGFLGAAIMAQQLADGVKRHLVGVLPDGRAPARADTPIQNMQGAHIGVITSGGFSPSLGRPIAMGYVAADYAVGAAVNLLVRNKTLPAKITALPFIKKNFANDERKK